MRSNLENIGHASRTSAIAWLTGLGLALLVLIPAWVLILAGDYNGRGAFDQLNYHEPAIVRFAQQWPTPDLSNYLSATTPGYHVVLAAAAQVIGTDRTALQLVASLFTGALFTLLGATLASRVGPRRAIGLALPLAGSIYVFFPAVWLLPDNAAWLGVLGVLLIALSGRFNARVLVSFTLAATALVLIRQVHLWTLAPMWTAAFLGATDHTNPANDRLAWDIRALWYQAFSAGVRRVLLTIALSAIPCAALALFARQWGGLTPPHFLRHQGANPAAPAFVLAIFGALGPFFIPVAWNSLTRTLSANRGQILTGAAVGLLLALMTPTTYDQDAGRWTGLWNLARSTPEFADRSALITGLATIGGAVVMALLGTLGRRDRWIFAATILAYIAALSATHEIWHRYVEPLVLLLLALMVARGARSTPTDPSRSESPTATPPGLDWGMVWVCVLGVGLAAVTSLTIAQARPVRDLRLYELPEFQVDGWKMPPGVVGGIERE